MKNFALVLFLTFSLVSCGVKTYRLENEASFVSTEGSHKITATDQGIREDFTSTSAGNLIATAIREVHKLDVALYPRDLINDENVGFVSASMNGQDVESLLNIYPLSGNKDEFMIGVMRGADIKKLIRTRIQDTFNLDIEVAGMVYHVHMVAGVVQGEGTFGLDNGRKFEDRESYRVAINQHFFFSGETFPSYKFRNGLNFSFVPNGDIISAKETLRTYLKTVGELPYLSEARGRFSKLTLNDIGFKPTYEIQGNSHRSPVWGHKVRTRGIVTALDGVDWFPRGIDIIIQDPNGDGRDDTSDALHVHLTEDVTDVKVGDEIEVAGTVYEHMTLDMGQNMSKTVLREITDLKILKSNQPLPKPVIVGYQGRPIPDRTLSTWVGDLNFKPFLTLTDGIDFWESLEGMRVTINNPRVTGFRGGQEELMRLRPQRHLSLYIVPDGFRRKETRTLSGGIVEDFMSGDFNPEVIHLSAGHLTADLNRIKPSNPRKIEDCEEKGGRRYQDEDGTPRCRVPSGLTNTDYHYNVGDIFKGGITGILSFESNLFGGGEYTLVLPQTIYRYDENVNNGDDAPCLVRSLEYLNPNYNELFEGGVEKASCEQILKTREKVADRNPPEEFQNIATGFLTKEFTSDNTINCLDVDFFRKPMPFECRPVTKLKGQGRHLTIAAFNLENLAGNQEERLQDIGKAIRFNMKCPDIISLVEIQDNNGLDLQGGANADLTISKLINRSGCIQEGVRYKGINVDPINHNEGGQPGGNIRVAMIYNSARVKFRAYGENTDGPLADGSLQETRVTEQGNLSINPGRVFPNSEAFKNTRKSIVAQFEFEGEKVFVIGNHFNSKLGDTSFMGAQQPPYPESDEERATLAMGINEFVRILELREPQANIVVLGDFNAQYNERSMRTLENEGDLINLMFHKDLVHPNDRYSHNHNGSSSAIDFIFANKNLTAKDAALDVLHINSDYMGRLSDHDPVVARFYFGEQADYSRALSGPLSESNTFFKINIKKKGVLKQMLANGDNFIQNGVVYNPLLFGETDRNDKLENTHCKANGIIGRNPWTIAESQFVNKTTQFKLKSQSGAVLSVTCSHPNLDQELSLVALENIFGGAIEATR
jgi:endonuclease/exonuclease/phosphatase family metal-dependent hydrolase